MQDAIAEVNRESHETELKTMNRVFADVKTTDQVVAMLTGVAAAIPPNQTARI